MSDLLTLILAAGKGTRMKSSLPKVLHKVGGRPMLAHVLEAASDAGSGRNIVVVGFGAETVQQAFADKAEFVVQAEQLGTGHAVLQAAPLWETFQGTIMVLCGDTPLLEGAMLRDFCQYHRQTGASATVLTANMPDPAGYGRIIRGADGSVEKIVEQKDASPAELAVTEVNTGIYCFERAALADTLQKITCSNQQGEYYLTDAIGILAAEGKKVSAIAAQDYRATLGINSRIQLADAEKIIRRRKTQELMDSGVTIMDPDSTFIDAGVAVGKDTIIYPFTWLEGTTAIGSGCEIGPSSRLQDTAVGDHVVLSFTYAHECRIEDGVTVGPYAHLRPNTVLHAGVKVGNFVEVKNSEIGEKSKLPHLSYIGDTDMGSGVNVGCGAITVNYDGKVKHRTTIEDRAFVGCNCNLVAPVTVGEGAYVAAGSTITKHVPPAALGVARARQQNLEGWVEKRQK